MRNGKEVDKAIGQALHDLRSQKGNRTLESQWILRQLGDEELTKEVTSLSVVALHILSSLKEKDLTGVELASRLEVTRGAITRAAGNLTAYHFVKVYQLDVDKKKIFYQLTDKGRKVAAVHDKMHEKIDEIFNEQIFLKYTENEKRVILGFLTDVNAVDDLLNEML
ncbi:transcriptional regulator [Lactococcus protaetiae]|uniref:Transcriptional regulator n=1 Tax=Lactococcus protaetiae TaxID=2592653 RepID=A0A514Z8A5_9LACT|nr:transcriptional regulator [Lactococcus protaetiae]QDK70820.1 transcriptional regulator [Lactococcus protaetiae]